MVENHPSRSRKASNYTAAEGLAPSRIGHGGVRTLPHLTFALAESGRPRSLLSRRASAVTGTACERRTLVTPTGSAGTPPGSGPRTDAAGYVPVQERIRVSANVGM